MRIYNLFVAGIRRDDQKDGMIMQRKMPTTGIIGLFFLIHEYVLNVMLSHAIFITYEIVMITQLKGNIKAYELPFDCMSIHRKAVQYYLAGKCIIFIMKTNRRRRYRKIGFVWIMVFNATFNNISVMSWRTALLLEETGVLGEKSH